MKFLSAIVLAGLALGGAIAAPSPQTQPPAAPKTQATGIVTTVDASSRQVSLKTATGDVLTLTTADQTQILHAQPGEADPKKWSKLTLSEIHPGDQALAYFRGTPDQKPLLATTLVIRTKSDLNDLATKQLDDWKKRGTSGTVTAIDPSANSLTVKAGPRIFTVQPSDKTVFHRYSLDSAKFTDAKPSSFAEIKTGDQVNVLGDKSADGAIRAESIFAGSFRQIAAQIVSIDPASGEMKVTDLATKKPLSIRVNSDAALKRLPEPMAQSLARRYQNTSPANPGRGGGDIGQMLDRLPSIPFSDLKPKDAIMVSTTMGSDPSKVTAIMLLAGVEPILTAAPDATRDIMSGWNLGGGAGEGNQ